MQQAQTAGCAASNGIGMLIYKGALAFEIWLGVRPGSHAGKGGTPSFRTITKHDVI
jgi:shikimate 5-dehydrogenase